MLTPLLSRRLALLTAGLLTCYGAAAQHLQRGALPPEWAATSASELATVRTATRPDDLLPRLQQFRALTLDVPALTATLRQAPLETAAAQRPAPPVILNLPTPDGTTIRFQLFESPVMAPALAAQYPMIHTYAGVALDRPGLTLRADLTPQGFHAQVLGADGQSFYIDPLRPGDAQHYAAYFPGELRLPTVRQGCATPSDPAAAQRLANLQRPAVAYGTQLRTFRLALACTAEYVQFQGGTTNAQSAITTTINRVTGIYQRELAVRLQLTQTLLFTDAATDPYTNGDGERMMNENQAYFDAHVTASTYDIGHVFGTNSGGIARLGSVCQNADKARGMTGSSYPRGDAFDVDYVAHEMGHQFGANHTFNSERDDCGGGNRNGATAYEPGSGATIMAYAGICGSDNLQANSDPYFHLGSINEMQAYISGQASCPATVSTGNTAPTVTTPINKSIPLQTPFKLTTTGTDANGDPLTYCWEEMDLGQASNVVTQASGQANGSTYPLLRSWAPSNSPTRYFPRLQNLVTNNWPFGEALPVIARTMKFRCTVRDTRTMTGGVVAGATNTTNDVTLNVVSTAGPFRVTSQSIANGIITLTQPFYVYWDVANTNQAPINCATVNLRLSNDGGLTWPRLLASGVPNNGSYQVTLPASDSTLITTPSISNIRLMVEAADNYFFNINSYNQRLLGAPQLIFSPLSGTPGTRVTITLRQQNNYMPTLNVQAVKLNGVTIPHTVKSYTTLEVIVPTTATSGNFEVLTDLSRFTNGTFQVLPSVRSFTPTAGVKGTPVTITLSSAQAASVSSVRFNGMNAPFTVVSSTQVRAAVPEDIYGQSAGTGPISVRFTTQQGGSGQSVSTTSFTVLHGIREFTAKGGNVGDSVYVQLDSFTGGLANPAAAATALTFSGPTTAGLPVPFVRNGTHQLRAVVPATAVTGPLKVTYGTTGSATSATSFRMAPVVTSLSPVAAGAGMTVTLTGKDFVNVARVVFTGADALIFTVVSTTKITATVPAGALTGPIRVVLGGTDFPLGLIGPASPTFTVVPTPTISSVTGNAWASQQIQISGAAFTGATSVKFNGVGATFTVSSATLITASIPATASTGPMTITTPGGTASYAYTIFPKPGLPSVTSFTPTSGPPGTTITITGTNFTFAAGAVTTTTVGTTTIAFGVGAGNTIISATQATVVVPIGCTSGKITISGPNGTSTASAATFTVTSQPAPTITGFSPTTASAGMYVAVTGTDLTGVSAATINGVSAPLHPYLRTATSVSILVPSGVTTGLIRLTTPGGTAASSTSLTIVPAPTITSFSPTSGAVNTLVTVSGTNLAGITQVQIGGGTMVAPVSTSSSQLTFRVPTGSLTGTIFVSRATGFATSAGTFTVTGARPEMTAAARTAPLLTADIIPNPAHDWIWISRDGDNLPSTTLELTDALGRIVRQAAFPVNSSRAELDLRGLVPGLYLVRLAGGSPQRLIVE